MENRKSVSILGCGWLGLELAKSLIAEGWKVKASTTSVEKISQLEDCGIEAYLVQFNANNKPDLNKFLDSDVLIISIPPGRNNPDGQNSYQNMLEILTSLLPESKIAKVILVSSTSVYGDVNKEVTEADLPQPDTDSGKLLLNAEQQFLALNNIKVVIVRPSGLVGNDRFPGKFFTGKTNIPNGLSPVNMIHKTDISGIIKKLVNDENADGIYNACSPNHPVKKDFYALAAKKINLNPPGFLDEKVKWKTVKSDRVKQELNYDFVYPDLMEWLKSYQISN
ncbi:MAG: SDR family oxidoreductase [Daejeonella sp.]